MRVTTDALAAKRQIESQVTQGMEYHTAYGGELWQRPHPVQSKPCVGGTQANSRGRLPSADFFEEVYPNLLNYNHKNNQTHIGDGPQRGL